VKGGVTDKVVGSPSYLYLNVEIILDSLLMPIKHGRKNKHTSSHKLYGLPDRCAKNKKKYANRGKPMRAKTAQRRTRGHKKNGWFFLKIGCVARLQLV
jgi:hypothetical protein